MKIQEIGHLFRFTYTKSSAEILAKMEIKAAALRSKVIEREERVAKVRAEYKITDAVLVDLLRQARAAAKRNADLGARMSYNISSRKGDVDRDDIDEELVIGAGVVDGLLTESDLIEAETSQIARLELIGRNLKDEEREWSEGRKVGWSLGEDELRYLGF